MSFSLEIQMVEPKRYQALLRTFDKRGLVKRFDKALQAQEKKAIQEIYRRIKYWTDPPQITTTRKNFTSELTISDLRLLWVSEGTTGPQFIFPVRAPYLRFSPQFSPKSFPGNPRPSPGVRGGTLHSPGKFISAKSARYTHSGGYHIEPRNIIEESMEKAMDSFVDELFEAITNPDY